MITARAPMGMTPMMRVIHDDESQFPRLAELFNPQAARFYLLETEPYDPDAMTTVLRTFGAGLSRLKGAENRLWRPRLEVGFNVEVQLFEGGGFELGGVGRTAFGVMQIAHGDEVEQPPILRDELTWLLWPRRALRLYLGGNPALGWVWTDYTLIFSGLAEDAAWDEDRFTIIVRDPTVKLEVPIQTTLYAGTGGDEGGIDLKGKTKPLCYGRPPNVSPVLVDRANLIYQLHDGPVVAIPPVYDKGDVYVSDGDTSDLRAWVAVSGHLKTDLSRGMFRLGSTPNGLVTSSPQGDSDGGVLREKQGELIRRILVSRGGFVDGVAGNLDLASLARLDSYNRQVGIYLREPGATTVAQVVDSILLPRGYRSFDSVGRFVAGVVDFSAPSLTLAPPRIVSIARDRTPLPSWRISLGYARNWTPMQETDLAVGTIALDRDFATNEFRRVTKEDAAIKTRQPGASDDTVDTFWTNEDDAQAEVDAAWALLSANRDAYKIVAQDIQFRLRAAQTVTVVHSRFGLDVGRNFIILGIAEDTKSGSTTLSVWG